MNDIERAIRYICLFEAEDDETRVERYKVIEQIMHGDEELIARYAKKYENLLDMLS